MTWFTLLLCVGATLRLYRIWAIDEIAAPLTHGADWALERLPARLGNWLSMLLTCPFCLGFWISGVVVTLGYYHGDSAWFVIPSATLTASYMMGHLYNRLEEDSER